MPPRGRNSDVVRLVRGDRGRVRLHTELILRFDYGRAVPWVSRLEDGTLRAIAGPDMVTLRTPVELRGEDLTTRADFEVAEGSVVPFVLTHGPSHRRPPQAIDPDAALRQTERFWREWVAKNPCHGEWADAVTRSLITLKALTYAPTGGMVAAPTTSLPEALGGSRNWDYRYCWLRDATLTLLAFMNAGYFEEACAWRDWLLRAAAGAPSQLQIMYGLAGERRLTEYEVPWLPGYEGSAPVRIGNAAHGQLQLDVFGEVMDALHQARRGGLQSRDEDWAFQRAMLEHLGSIWHQPDEGLWEVRAGRRHFTHSKVMAWVAFDRGIRAAETFGFKGPIDRWRRTRQAIHEDVCTRGFDPRDRELRPVVRLEGTRRESAAHSDRRVSSSGRPTGARARWTRWSAACSSTVSCAATTRRRVMTAFPVTKARSSPAPSGWPTPTSSWAASTTRGGCSRDCLNCATMSGCLPRSTIPCTPAGRELSTGVLAHRARQHGP